MTSQRIPTTIPGDAEAPMPPERFVFNESDPAIQRLLAAGIPKERLVAADMPSGPYED